MAYKSFMGYSKNDHVVIIPIFLSVFALYLWSAPATVVLEDDGLFILSAYFNGVSHPPGYPLYTLLAHLATQLPGSTVAFNVHALSALFGALACCCIYRIATKLIKNRVASILAAVSFGLSEVFWSQAIIAEVYTLNALLFFLAVLLCFELKAASPEKAPRLLYLTALTCGLGCSNHWPLFILSSPLLAGILWPFDKIRISGLLKSIPFFLAGLAPYLWMIIRSQMDPVISFYGPISNWQEFWFFISRKGYSAIDSSLTVGWADRVHFVVYFFRQFSVQYGLAGFLFVIIGYINQLRFWSIPVATGLSITFLCNSVVLTGLLGFDYDLFHQSLFRVYPHIAYGIGSIWLALGFHVVANYLSLNYRSYINLETAAYSLALLIVGMELFTNLPLNYRASDTWSERYARVVLENLEDNAALFTFGENTIGPLAYLNMIESVRPDVTLYSSQGLVLSNRLYSFNETAESKKQKNDRFIRETDRPVYFMSEFENSYGNYYLGLFLRVNKNSTDKTTIYQINKNILDSFLHVIEAPIPQDTWQKLSYQFLRADYCRLTSHFIIASDDFEKSKDDWIDESCKTYIGYLKLVDTVLDTDSPDLDLLKTLIDRAESLQAQAIDKKSTSLIDYYRGIFFSKTGNRNAAVAHLEKSISIWPHPDNVARQKLSEVSGTGNPTPRQ